MNTPLDARRGFLSTGFLAGAALFGRNAQAAGACPDGSSAAGSKLLDLYIAAVNARALERFGEFTAENYIQNSGRSPNGLAALQETFKRILASMPDVELRAEDRIVAGDRVVARMSFTATHTPPIQGIAPTGRRFTLRTIDIWRVETGKFAEHWDLVDCPGLVKQLSGA